MPLASIVPIIRGRAWYPPLNLLKSISGYKCPSMSYYTKCYPDRIMTYYQVNSCDQPLRPLHRNSCGAIAAPGDTHSITTY